MMAKVGSLASCSARIFSERVLADIRGRDAIVVILRAETGSLNNERILEMNIQRLSLLGQTLLLGWELES
jgi:hypothetical protein